MKAQEAHPILSCEETKSLEARLLKGDVALEWQVMQKAGRAVAEGVRTDYREYGRLPRRARILVLAGKGHNAGDALIAVHHLLRKLRGATAHVVFIYGREKLKPLVTRAWTELQEFGKDRVEVIESRQLAEGYEISLDGIFGFQFRPPLDEVTQEILNRANSCKVTLRAAVDLPSGLGAENAFRADFTYATGVVKRPGLETDNAGRLRYLDLGFFDDPFACVSDDLVLTERVLDPLRDWRDPRTEKRQQGHLFIVAGSRNYPGAALMAVTAALRSGVGLVSAFVPETLVPAFAAQVPEAIWVGWPETPGGGLALEGIHLLRERLPRASALVMGPGLGREAETQALAIEIMKMVEVPVLLDADALQTEVIAQARGPLVLTPHAGEYARIAGERELSDYASERDAVVVLK